MSYDLNQPLVTTPITAEEENNKVTEFPQDQQKVVETINTAQRLYYTKWHKSGSDAKHKGWSRTPTPYYNNAIADYFFHCGFDGVGLEQAIETMEAEMVQINKDSI